MPAADAARMWERGRGPEVCGRGVRVVLTRRGCARGRPLSGPAGGVRRGHQARLRMTRVLSGSTGCRAGRVTRRGYASRGSFQVGQSGGSCHQARLRIRGVLSGRSGLGGCLTRRGYASGLSSRVEAGRAGLSPGAVTHLAGPLGSTGCRAGYVTRRGCASGASSRVEAGWAAVSPGAVTHQGRPLESKRAGRLSHQARLRIRAVLSSRSGSGGAVTRRGYASRGSFQVDGLSGGLCHQARLRISRVLPSRRAVGRVVSPGAVTHQGCPLGSKRVGRAVTRRGCASRASSRSSVLGRCQGAVPEAVRQFGPSDCTLRRNAGCSPGAIAHGASPPERTTDGPCLVHGLTGRTVHRCAPHPPTPFPP